MCERVCRDVREKVRLRLSGKNIIAMVRAIENIGTNKRINTKLLSINLELIILLELSSYWGNAFVYVSKGCQAIIQQQKEALWS